MPARAKSSKSARSSARVGADAGDVRDDRQADLLLNLLCERDGARAGRTAGAVGDRDERRPQGLRAPRSCRKSRREPSSSLGGKNSNEKNGRCVASASLMRIERLRYRKLAATPPQSSAQPSTMTKSSSLTGSETTGGLSIIMPSPISIAATAKSIATNGR